MFNHVVCYWVYNFVELYGLKCGFPGLNIRLIVIHHILIKQNLCPLRSMDLVCQPANLNLNEMWLLPFSNSQRVPYGVSIERCDDVSPQ